LRHPPVATDTRVLADETSASLVSETIAVG
jgi:hypothetical protein